MSEETNLWTSMQDASPPEQKNYLTVISGGDMVVTEWLGSKWLFDMPVTHWREMPEGPKKV